MSPSGPFYRALPDGTLKHIHPVLGTEVWTVPSRALRPFVNRQSIPPQSLSPRPKEDYCDFCETHYLRTPPEKSRVIRDPKGHFVLLEKLDLDSVKYSKAFFRRMANLFEIVTFDYWSKNHQVQLSPAQKKWKEDYLGSSQGLQHVQDLTKIKLSLAGKTPSEIDSLIAAPPEGLYDPFFGGTHEVLATGRHFRPGAATDDQLFSSGEMTPDEHHAFFEFAVKAALDIRSNNAKVAYVAIFQNWLRAAGASFDHLHKQVVGLDVSGPGVDKRLKKAQESPDIFNQDLVDFSFKNGLIVAENDFGVVISEIGHPYPTLGIYSKSRKCRPWELSAEEFRGFSDLVHASHAAAGPSVPCNEAWFYPPWDSPVPFPFHVQLHWRTITSAGFETATQIFVNPVPPSIFQKQVTERLLALRPEGKIAKVRIAQEVQLKPGSLLYGR